MGYFAVKQDSKPYPVGTLGTKSARFNACCDYEKRLLPLLIFVIGSGKQWENTSSRFIPPCKIRIQISIPTALTLNN